METIYAWHQFNGSKYYKDLDKATKERDKYAEKLKGNDKFYNGKQVIEVIENPEMIKEIIEKGWLK